jgi:hypothetical protein
MNETNTGSEVHKYMGMYENRCASLMARDSIPCEDLFLCRVQALTCTGNNSTMQRLRGARTQWVGEVGEVDFGGRCDSRPS